MALFKKDVLQSAEKLVRKGKIEAAIKEYKKVVAKNPGDTSTLNRVGDLYVRLRKHAHAVDYYMKTAERYALDGFYVKAIAVYKKVQRIDPAAVEVHGRLADLYAKQGLVNDARNHFSQLADNYLRNNDTPSAIRTYEKIIDLDQENPTPLLRLADLYREDGQPTKASAAYERIAAMMIERGQVDHAIQVYERALVVEAENLDFISQAVLKIRDVGGVDRALDLVAKAEAHNPAASELRSLVAPPKGSPGPVSGGDADTLEAPLPASTLSGDGASDGTSGGESSGALGGALDGALVPPPLPTATAEVPSPRMAADEEIDLALDLQGDLESEREESRPALVDPASFGAPSGTLESPSEVELPASVVEEAPVMHAPPEPFQLQSPTGGATEIAEPSPGMVPPGVSGQELQEDRDAVDEEAGREEIPEPLLASGEIDLGDLGDIALDVGEVDAATELGSLAGETPVEVFASQPELSVAEGVDLDAAFDRQVDPGPIDLGVPLGGSQAGLAENPPLDVDTNQEEETEAGLKGDGVETDGTDQVDAALEEKLSEAGVFRKYGLLDKALDRLNEVLALVPDHLDALSQAIHVLVERGDEARVSTKAETLHLLCAQQNQRTRWEEIQELLVGEGYQIEEDRIRTPSELAMSMSLSEEAPAHDPYDHQPPEEPEAELPDSDFSALASEPLEIDHGQGHDMLDSKEFPLQNMDQLRSGGAVPELGESSSDAPSEGATGEASDELPPEVPGVAEVDDATPSWLDGEAPGESEEAGELFAEEEEFFDLASELQDEFGTGLSDLEASLPENAAEQSLEEIVEGFKQGVAENISEEESDTHYNLGIAYREMMLLDEAVNEFQISAKSPDYLVESCAMLGLCFREKGMPDLSAKWYRRGTEAPQLQEEQRIGMLYELADSLEASGETSSAEETFQQVASISGDYRDIEERLSSIARAANG